jgi:hypothetical protein
MARIVAGRLDTEQEIEGARRGLAAIGVPLELIASFQVVDAGRHDLHPIGGDADHDRGTLHSSGGAWLGIAAGALAGAVLAGTLNWILVQSTWSFTLFWIAAGAGVGAYFGSLAGALLMTRDPDAREASPREPVSRRGGPMIAAQVGEDARLRVEVCSLMTRLGADRVEEAEGTIRGGEWVDFDPRLSPQPIGNDSQNRQQAAPAAPI